MKWIALSACLFTARIVTAKEVQVTIYSDPPGATVYADAGALNAGTAPTIVKYPSSKGFDKHAECVVTSEVKVRWASGVEASVEHLNICPQSGRKQQFTFVRPNLAGRDYDVQVGWLLQRLAAQAREATANREAADFQRLLDALKPPPRPPAIHCTSTIVGAQIWTDCN